MKDILNGLLVSFSLYSSIPVKQVEWQKNTMRWALSFITFIGVIIGFLELIWYKFCVYFNASPLFYCSIATLIPIIISGGIHLDGLCDTCDALCSFGNKQKKLEILKDPHVGAFGVIWLISFVICEIAFFSQIYKTPKFIFLLFFGFSFSRALGACKIVTLQCAKNSGLAHIFSENSDKKIVFFTLIFQIIIFLTFNFIFCVFLKANIVIIVLFYIFMILFYFWHNKLCKNLFGGITGDLAGFFISLSELVTLAFTALGGMIL